MNPSSLTSGYGLPDQGEPEFPDSASRGSNPGGSAGMRDLLPTSGTTRMVVRDPSTSGGMSRAADDPGALGTVDRVELPQGVMLDPHGVPLAGSS